MCGRAVQPSWVVHGVECGARLEFEAGSWWMHPEDKGTQWRLPAAAELHGNGMEAWTRHDVTYHEKLSQETPRPSCYMYRHVGYCFLLLGPSMAPHAVGGPGPEGCHIRLGRFLKSVAHS